MAANSLRVESRFHGYVVEAPVQLLPGYSNVSNSCLDGAHNMFAIMTRNGDGILMRRDVMTGEWERVFVFDDLVIGKVAGCSLQTLGEYIEAIVSEREPDGAQVQKVYLLGGCGVVARPPWPPTGRAAA